MPPEWPQPHPYAEDFDRFWLVHQLPPLPWPASDGGPVDHQLYGPTDTEWLFSVGSYIDRLSLPGVQSALGSAGQRLLDEARSASVPLGSSWGWRTPASHDSPAEGRIGQSPLTIRCVRAVIHGKVGTLEEVAHVLHLRTDPTPDIDMDKAALDTLGPKVVTAWRNFWLGSATTTGNSTIRGYFPPDLVYDEVRLSYLEFLPGINPVTNRQFKPNTLVPTQFYPFADPTVMNGSGGTQTGQGGVRLPNECALALSLGTSLRGPRHRGRTYLGPLMSSLLDSNGGFGPIVDGIGKAFGDQFLTGVNTGTGVKANVLSRADCASYPITGIRTGHVVDSQRRRRKSLPENYAQAWGTPAGV